jgi:hypothetical protein
MRRRRRRRSPQELIAFCRAAAVARSSARARSTSRRNCRGIPTGKLYKRLLRDRYWAGAGRRRAGLSMFGGPDRRRRESTLKWAGGMTMSGSELLVTRQERVAVLTLNRPEALNAYTPSWAHDLEQAVLDANADPGVRVIVITGAGRGFCAGADMEVLQGVRPARQGADATRDGERAGDTDAADPDWQAWDRRCGSTTPSATPT